MRVLFTILIFCSLFFKMLIAEAPKNISNTQENVSTEKQNLSDEELKLMYQIFIYKSDLDKAYQVAQKALHRHPDDLVWHERMAKVAQWSDRPRIAMKHWLFVYKHKPTAEMRDRLLDFALQFYQYEKVTLLVADRLKSDPSCKNVQLFAYIWEGAGEPEVASRKLFSFYGDHLEITCALEEALRISLELGDMQYTGKMIAFAEKHGIVTEKLAKLSAYYYYTQHDLEQSYATLRKIGQYEHNNVDYLRQLGDLGWYLGDRDRAVRVSLRIEALGQAKKIDYERIIVEGKKHPQAAMKAALEGWKTYAELHFFLTYAYLSLDHKNYTSLVAQIENLEGQSDRFEMFQEDPLYYLIKAQAYQGTGNNKAAYFALQKAKQLAPNNIEILSSLIWFYMDAEETEHLQSLLRELTQKGISKGLYLPVAGGYFYLQQGDRALYYLSHLLKTQSQNIEVKFFYAYILQVQDEPQAAMMQFKEIFEKLEKRRKQHASVMKDALFLDNYLRSGIHRMGADRFVSTLKNAKPYLSKEQHDNLSVLWSLRNEAREQANIYLKQMKRPERWMLLSQALHFNDRDKMQRLLYKSFVSLPIRDRVEAARRSGNIAMGYTLAFEGMKTNRKDPQLYNQYRDIVHQRADIVSLEPGYFKRASMIQNYVEIRGRNYLNEGFWLESNLLAAHNRLTDRDTVAEIPSNDISAWFMLKKEFNRGSLALGAGYRNAMDDFVFGKFALEWQLSDRFRTEINMGYHDRSEETIYLLLGGHKDYADISIGYDLLSSTQLTFAFEFDRFHSQDDQYLGKGYVMRLGATRIFRIGYPDITIGPFAEYGRYDVKEGNKGIIERLNPFPLEYFKALPNDFDNYGISFAYGMQNMTEYTRVWRPYMEVTPFYDAQQDQASFSLNLGIGGSVYNQDHLIFGVDYNQAVNGTKEEYLKLFLRYKLYY